MKLSTNSFEDFKEVICIIIKQQLVQHLNLHRVNGQHLRKLVLKKKKLLTQNRKVFLWQQSTAFQRYASSSFPLRTPAKHLITDTKQPANPNDTIWQNAPQPFSPTLSKKPKRVLKWKWGYDLSLIVITVFRGLFLLSSPLRRLSVNTHCLFQRLGCWLGPLTQHGQKRQPPPSLFYHDLFIPCQAQAQIRDSNTLVKSASLKAYVSLPSTCIRVLAFPVCTHCLLH